MKSISRVNNDVQGLPRDSLQKCVHGRPDRALEAISI